MSIARKNNLRLDIKCLLLKGQDTCYLVFSGRNIAAYYTIEIITDMEESMTSFDKSSRISIALGIGISY